MMDTPATDTFIELARASDRAELLDFIHGVFRRGDPNIPRFEAMYPDLMVATDEAMSRHAIVRLDGRIVSCVGMYGMLLQAGGCRVPIAGIGQVSTAADMLGRGFMTVLLKFQLERARREGAVLAWLGGRHDRYAHFGFEVAGLWFKYVGDTHSTSGIRRTRAISCVPASPESITPELFALREATVDGVIEPIENYRLRLRRAPFELWTATPSGESAPDAWAIVVPGQSEGRIEEWCGSEDGRIELFAAVAAKFGRVVRDESSAPKPLNRELRRFCSWMGPGCDQLAVLDRDGLLAAYGALVPSGTEPPPAGLDAMEFVRHVFGPEQSAFPRLPFLLPGFNHV